MIKKLLTFLLIANLAFASTILFAGGDSGVHYPDEVTAHWTMNALTGGESDNRNSYDLTETGTVPSATGKVDKARGVFSTSNYFSWLAGGSAATTFDSSLFILEFWMKGNTTSQVQVIASKWDSNVGWYMQVDGNDKLALHLDANDQYTSTTTYVDGNWHYVVTGIRSTSGANEIRLYVDNVLQNQAAGNTYSKHTGDLGVGLIETSVDIPFIGLLDEVAWWDLDGSSLTWAQIETIIDRRWSNGNGRRYSKQ